MTKNWMYRVKSNTLQNRLFNDLENGIYTDVTFMVGTPENQRAFKVHRLVLAAETPEFEKILQSGVKFEIPDVNPKGFENVIRFCYGEDLRFLEGLSDIRKTFYAAEKFNVQKLKLVLENFLIELLRSEAVIEILQVSFELKMPLLKAKCLEMISSQFEKVLMTEELVSAPREVIELVLSLCPHHGLEFKVCALVSLLGWVKKHECPDDITIRLLAMVKDEHFVSDDIVSILKTQIDQLTENQFLKFIKGFVAKQFCSLQLSPLIASIDTVRNISAASPESTTISKDEASKIVQKTLLQEEETVVGNITVVSPEGTITKDEVSKIEQKILLQEEAIIDQAKLLQLEAGKEIVADREKTSELKAEKERAKSDGSKDECLVMAVMSEDFKNISQIIKSFVTRSTERTEERMIKATFEAMNLASNTIKAAIEVFIDSKEQEAEIANTDTTGKPQVSE